MKKQVLLLFAALTFCQAAFAYDFSAVAPSGDTLYYDILSGSTSVEVVRPSSYWYWYTKPTGDLVIPDSVNYNGRTYQVTSIQDWAFQNCRDITSVTIGNCVTSIARYAFEDCRGLASVTIGTSVTSVGQDAFSECNGLTEVRYNGTIGQWCGINFYSFSSNPLSYAHHLYINNAEVTSVSIPNTVTEIKPVAFSGCTGLTSVIIPNSVTRISQAAFRGCTSLTTVTLGDSVTSLGGSTFYGCSSLTSVNIPNSVTYIGSYTFYGCSSLTTITLPDSLSTIESNAFSGCSGLTISLTIPNSVSYIGISAFTGCSGLTSVSIGRSTTSIGKEAFLGCSGLTSVTIGKSVSYIGSSAFYGCSGLMSITFLGMTPPEMNNQVFHGAQSDIPVYIPCGSLSNYESTLPYFINYIEIEQQFEFSAVSADESMGTVQVLNEPSCSDLDAVLNAVPANGYRFDHWSTGSTDNPYTLTVTSDTTIIAYFVSDGGGTGIGEIGTDNIRISVSDGRIIVEGVAEEEMRVYDITGRIVQNRTLPSGVYMVKISTLPAQKVVVIRK